MEVNTEHEALPQAPTLSRYAAASGDDTPVAPTYRKSRMAQAAESVEDKFKATKTWNNIVRHFRNEMPLKRHRRQLSYYENSFTGKEAVDFMLLELPSLVPGKDVQRANAFALMQKLLDQNVFKRPRVPTMEGELFRDNATLYIFCEDEPLDGLARTPRLIQRANSYNGSADRGSRSRPHARFCRVESPASWEPFEIPKSPPKHKGGYDRRISSSHGNLATMIANFNKKTAELENQSGTVTECSSQDSIAETMDSERAEVDYELGDMTHTPTCDRTRIENLDAEVDKENDVRCEEEDAYGRFVDKRDKKKKVVKPAKEEEKEKENAYEWLNFVRRKKNYPSTPAAENKTSSANVLGERNGRGSIWSRKESRMNGHSTAPCGVMPTFKDSDYAPITISHRIVTEVDMWNIYRACTLNRLRRIMQLEEISFLSWSILGKDIKWNCDHVGSSGVVRPRNDRDGISEDFSSYLMRLMRYLEQFPFPSGTSNVITYKDNQEVNVFKTVCSHLSREPHLLLNEEAAALIYVISTICEQSQKQAQLMSPGYGIHKETVFDNKSTPLTRFVARGTSVSSLLSPSSGLVDFPVAIRLDGISEGTQVAFHADDVDDGVRYVDATSPLSHSDEAAAKARRYTDKFLSSNKSPIDYEDVLRLPGVKCSPELIKKIDDLTVSQRIKQQSARSSLGSVGTSEASKSSPISSSSHHSATSSSYRTAASTISPSLDKLSRDNTAVLLEAVSLVLLTLPPARRRRLHHIIRFMNKIASNHCLQLHKTRENRYVVLEGLCSSVVESSGERPLNASQSLHLITLLMDNEKHVFRIPSGLKSDIELAVRERRREKVEEQENANRRATATISQATTVIATPADSMENKPVVVDEAPNPVTVNTPPANPVQYCEPIQPDEFTAQTMILEQEMLKLLDQICNDEYLSVEEKKKKLKKFKKTYPHIYSQRFQSPKLTEPKRKESTQNNGFFSRLFK